ncbi:pyridine nucleotide-disulfide oxidoreductase [Sulfolobales archaeon HS-7]|nr:pyridine nucleotide-disulfide oxidoreductase [Sulfolobales archaeon HS-7]
MKTVIVGSGPAGVYSAIMLARNSKVTLIDESEKLGGTCILYGCMPSKAMLHATHIIYSARSLGKELNFTQDEIIKLAKDTVNRLSKGVEYTLSSYDVEVIHGKAELSDGTIKVGNQSIDSNGIIVATGTVKPQVENTIASDDIPYLSQKISSAVIIGGGAGGVEYGDLLSEWGVDLSIVERGPTLLPNSDPDLSNAVTTTFKKKGVKLYLNKNVKKIEKGIVILDDETKITGDVVIFSFGRKPNVAGFEALSRGGPIKVDKTMYTGMGKIYAAGDVTGTYTAHEAIHEGIVASLNLLGIEKEFVSDFVPKVIYAKPEIATIGRMSGNSVKVNYAELGRAIAEKNTSGFLKLFYDGGRINGAVIYGEHAEDIANLISLIISQNLSMQAVFDNVFAHPSYMEILWEALGRALGYFRGK